MDAIKCGNFIANRRKELSMTQAELALKLNVTDKAVSRWERGLGLPDINSLEDLAMALEVSIYELIKSERLDENKEELNDSIKEIVLLANNHNDKYKKKVANSFILGILIIALMISLVWGIKVGFVYNWAIFGLIAYTLAIINLIRVIFIDRKYSNLLILMSMTFAILALISEYKLVSDWVIKEEWSSLMDVVPYMPPLLMIASTIGILINLVSAIIAEYKYSNYTSV